MLEFPQYNFSPIFSLIFIIFCVIYSFYSFFRHTNSEFYKEVDAGSSVFKPIFFGFIALIFLSCGFFSSIPNNLLIYKFRNIEISEISGFEITKLDGEFETIKSNKTIKFENSEIAQKMLKSLNNCESFQRNHESLSNGFRLKLLFKNENIYQNFYFSIILAGNATSKSAVLIPHSESLHTLYLGEFTCKEFEDSLKQYIQPLF